MLGASAPLSSLPKSEILPEHHALVDIPQRPEGASAYSIAITLTTNSFGVRSSRSTVLEYPFDSLKFPYKGGFSVTDYFAEEDLSARYSALELAQILRYSDGEYIQSSVSNFAISSLFSSRDERESEKHLCFEVDPTKILKGRALSVRSSPITVSYFDDHDTYPILHTTDTLSEERKA